MMGLFNSLPPADLSLATVIHSLSCPFSFSKPSFSRVVMFNVGVAYGRCCGLRVCRGVGHHATSIRLPDLEFSIALSLESHRHLRISIIDSIVGEFPAVLLVSSFVIRFSFISHIVHDKNKINLVSSDSVFGKLHRPVLIPEMTRSFQPPTTTSLSVDVQLLWSLLWSGEVDFSVKTVGEGVEIAAIVLSESFQDVAFQQTLIMYIPS
jgi:hypothetical protein